MLDKSYKTKQEDFWAGDFGNDYIDRNTYEYLIPKNIYEWSKIIERTIGIQSCIEFGSNIGANLKALKHLLPNLEMAAIEINRLACEKYLSKFLKKENIYQQSILEFNVTKQFDLVFVKGVLIHIDPNELQNVYKKMYDASKKYIVIAEYYNPQPVMIDYRGNADRLFKRDFAGEFMDKFSNIRLIDYGFYYHRDNNFQSDDITWFLMEKE